MEKQINYLLPYAKKIFVSYKELNGISNKYKEKILEIGNIIKKEIINFKAKIVQIFKRSKINLLILGEVKQQRYLLKYYRIFLKNVVIKILI